MFKRAASILMIVSLLGLGTGALQFLHELQHAAEDAQEDARDKAIALASQAASHAPPHEEHREQHHHDETNCQICAQLHMAMIAGAWVNPLVFLGILLTILSLAPVRITPVIAIARPTCRGPPSR